MKKNKTKVDSWLHKGWKKMYSIPVKYTKSWMLSHCIARPPGTSLVHLHTPSNKQINKQLYYCVNHLPEITCYKLQSNLSNADNEGMEQVYEFAL